MQCNDGPLIFFLVCSHSYDECMQVFTIFFSRNVLPCLVVCERAALPVLQDLHYIIYWDSKEPTISKQILLLSVLSKTANCIHSRSCSFFFNLLNENANAKTSEGNVSHNCHVQESPWNLANRWDHGILERARPLRSRAQYHRVSISLFCFYFMTYSEFLFFTNLNARSLQFCLMSNQF